MVYLASASGLTMVALVLVLGALSLSIVLGLALSKRRVRRKLPDDDTHVES